MSENFIVNAQPRVEQGTGASRRLRRTGFFPAVVYGGDQKPEMVTLDHNEMWKHLRHEAFYSHILTLKIGDREETVVLKDLQRHPVREQLLHADLLRVSENAVIRMRVPLHFLGEDVCPGVKLGGGRIERLSTEVEVECLPAALPEFINVDVSACQVGDSIHLSALTLPEGVTPIDLKHGNDEAVVAIHGPKGGAAAAAAE